MAQGLIQLPDALLRGLPEARGKLGAVYPVDRAAALCVLGSKPIREYIPHKFTSKYRSTGGFQRQSVVSFRAIVENTENDKSSKRKRIHCKMSYGRLFGCAIFCVAIPVEVCYHTL